MLTFMTQAELDLYRSTFGLGPMTIQQYDQNGNTLQYGFGAGQVAFSSGWVVEQMLDLDMASAACPCCPLIYVGANSAFFSDLTAAINTAVNKGAKVGSAPMSSGNISLILLHPPSPAPQNSLTVPPTSGHPPLFTPSLLLLPPFPLPEGCVHVLWRLGEGQP